MSSVRTPRLERAGTSHKPTKMPRKNLNSHNHQTNNMRDKEESGREGRKKKKGKTKVLEGHGVTTTDTWP